MNKVGKIVTVIFLIVAVVIVFAVKQNNKANSGAVVDEGSINSVVGPEVEGPETAKVDASKGLPRLVDLGADKCIPCKMMAPILEELKSEYEGTFKVEFIDVWKNPDEAPKYGIKLIPTQIFFDASGKELFRHEGFFSREDILSKWKEFGVDLSVSQPSFERFEPAQVDDRSKENICYMCDGDIAPRTLVTVSTEKGPVRLCSTHCYFIMYSCLTEDKTGFEKKVTVTDWASAQRVALMDAVYLYGVNVENGRPWIRAFAGHQAARTEQQSGGGSIVEFGDLKRTELSHRCGFCDRSCYPQDVAEVIAGGIHTYGCCSHCALGVAVRTGLDIEVHERDRLTGEPIIVRTLDGKVASLKPSTAIAWFGQRKKPDGTWGSAGCFHQGFFVTLENLKEWVDRNPHETGKMITIHQALANKMKLSPEQIQKACKIGECAPK
ncbi:MAG: thioredoxin fold domain-containing protein [Planctomycetes bacterium]|nr:thioredoxin fold domain-containing protein [Planctomycetota bacterium]